MFGMFCCCQTKNDQPSDAVPAVKFDRLEHDNSEYEFKHELESLDSLLFHPGSVDLTPASKDTAGKYAEVLKHYPEKAVKLVGFSVEELPTSGHNHQLARDRCRAIKSFFQAQTCTNGIAIQSRGTIDGRANEVIVEPCDPMTLDLLEAAATAQDASFVQEQKEAQARREAEVQREAQAQSQRETHAQREAQAQREAEERVQAVQEQIPSEPTQPDVQVHLVFSSRDGNSLTTQLVKRPIGLVFDLLGSQLSVKSVAPGSLAEDSGVKSKMVLTSIDGESVTNKSTNQAWEMLKLAVGKLPDK